MAIFQMFRDEFFLHTIGTSAPILKATHITFISFGARDINDLDSLASLPNEIDRIPLTSGNMSWVGKRFTFDFTIPNSNAVCATSIITAKDSTSTIISLTSGSAVFFEINNLIEIETSAGFIETKIIAKSGNNITISSPINALIGGLARKKVSHMIVLCNTTITPNTATDTCFLWIKNSFFKDSTASLHKKFQYDAN